MRAFKSLLIQVGVSALWPAYVALLAYAARVAPWPRSLARPLSFGLGVFALILFAAALARFLFGPGGFAESLGMPAPPARQARRAVWSLLGGMIWLLLPEWLLRRGLIVDGDRPVTAPVVARALGLAYEVVVWWVIFRLVRQRSPLVAWLVQGHGGGAWLARHRRFVAWLALGYIGVLIGLDARGYSFTARRLSSTGLQSTALLACGWFAYYLLVQLINRHAWRWVRPGSTPGGSVAPGASAPPDDLAPRLRRLAACAVPTLGILAGLWVWNIDLALFWTIADQPIWPNAAEGGVSVGDVAKALVIAVGTAVVWRHLAAFFSVAIFPRMPDDPGVRYAVLTLCRYLVLGLGLLAGLSAVHLGLEKIGVVLAALGVGLGFGLQEIVSNFICGIILLLERPIRVGDVVTVDGMNGKVDRINIRATTIINGDNQSMIIPNRSFITGSLVNWTHKDRVVRLSIPLGVAYGSDPDKVQDLLLAVAREDADVLRNPVPTAVMESFGASALNFILYAYVPDPSLVGRVRHRLCGQIQRRFESAGLRIPMPAHEVLVRAEGADWQLGPPRAESVRIDRPTSVPSPHTAICREPEPAEPSHRGVDE